MAINQTEPSLGASLALMGTAATALSLSTADHPLSAAEVAATALTVAISPLTMSAALMVMTTPGVFASVTAGALLGDEETISRLLTANLCLATGATALIAPDYQSRVYHNVLGAIECTADTARSLTTRAQP